MPRHPRNAPGRNRTALQIGIFSQPRTAPRTAPCELIRCEMARFRGVSGPASPRSCSGRPYDVVVNVDAREKVLTDAYLELHSALSGILYDEDPLGAGSSVGSPRAE